MKKQTVDSRDHLHLVCKMGIDRCRQQLAQLHALIHLLGSKDKEAVMTGAISSLLASLESELALNGEWLDLLAMGQGKS